MKTWWTILFFPVVSVVVVSLLVTEHAAKAAAPQGAAAATMAASVANSSSNNSGVVAIPDTTLAINSAQPLSQRVVHYEINAKYDAGKHIVDATETLTYHNLTGQSLDHFPFHLYQNAFQPNATWVRETKVQGGRDVTYEKWEEKDYGSEEIKSLEVVGQGDLTANVQYIQPDDGNKDDKTVVDVRLPRPIAPGEYVQFKIAFQTKFPETQARSGWKHDFVLGGQWFPKVGVFWHGAWNCHQYHAFTEFFADFGVYDVKLTVPQFEVVGASGVKVGEVDNPDSTKTVAYHGDDIHDFAWTASPRYKVKEDGIFQGQMGPVQMRILMQPAHWGQVARHEKILKESLEQFESRYGPYPYKAITLVDPESAEAGGMEYPTFITGDTSWFMPAGLKLPEVVIEHEFGHQYWYGMVATNEFEDAWMDEGINSYTEVKVLDAILGKRTSILNMMGATLGEREVQRLGYISAADLDPIAEKAYDYYNNNSYGGITYGKTASVLLTLEGIIGEDTMDKAMRAYFMKYRFTHPTKADFLNTIQEVSGRDLKWYFDQAIYGSPVLDYKVLKIESFPVNWYEEKKGKSREDEKNTVYRSYVWLQRKGEFVMPAEVEIKFDNGEKIREHWDGVSRWTKFTYEKKAKVESAELDPDHKIQIDRNDFNNSYTAEPNGKPALKLTNYWLFMTQWLGQALAWWAV
ncbi:MAG: M1 family metallopeptidase [Candidatus Sulfotelmatobacter sp.]